MQSGATWTLKFGKHQDFIVVNEVRKLKLDDLFQRSKKNLPVVSNLKTFVENY